MTATSRDFKRAVEFGLIVESRLDWRTRQYHVVVHTLDSSLLPCTGFPLKA